MTLALLLVAVLLLFGVGLRTYVPLFRWLYIPASVIAGFLGLAVMQIALRQRVAEPASGQPPGPWVELVNTLGSWPGWLIAVVFAGMLLERQTRSIDKTVPRVARQGLMVWIIVLGQTTIGLLATWLIIQPMTAVPNSFGMLIETGFAGGHGTAAAMGRVFAHPSIGLVEGEDLGMMMATFGLVIGVVTGMFWINIAVRRSWVPGFDRQSTSALSSVAEAASEAAEPADLPATEPLGRARISPATIDPLLLQVIWLALAFGVGLAIQQAVVAVATEMDAWWFPADLSADSARQELNKRLTLGSLADAFPLFIFTLFGGLAVRRGLRWCGLERALDAATISRLTSSAMDILVVAAISSLDLQAVAELAVPFAVLATIGTVWSCVCLIVLARWILPAEYWFQLGLINYGMSTGTTATGFVLLKVIDPELESGAAEDYALAAPISSPFVGGGMLTVALPLLLLERVPIWSAGLVLGLVVVVLIAIGKRWNAAEQYGPSNGEVTS